MGVCPPAGAVVSNPVSVRAVRHVYVIKRIFKKEKICAIISTKHRARRFIRDKHVLRAGSAYMEEGIHETC